MAYEKTKWVNNQTPLNESNLNKLEQGVKDAHDDIDQHQLEIDNVKDIVYNDHSERISLNETRIAESYSREDNKQDKLIAGENITIDPNTNVISSSGGSSGGNSNNPDGVTIVLNENNKLEIDLEYIMNGGYL